MHQKMPYSVADLLPVSSVVDAVMTVVTNPATNLNSLADLVAAAKNLARSILRRFRAAAISASWISSAGKEFRSSSCRTETQSPRLRT